MRGILSILLAIVLLLSLIMYFYGQNRSAQDQLKLRQLLINSLVFMIVAQLVVSILFISPKQHDKLFFGPFSVCKF